MRVLYAVASFVGGAALAVGSLSAVAAGPGRADDTGCPPVLNHKLLNLMDEPVSLCQYRGKVVLVVNTASQCGYTPQYEGLERLHRRYKDQGLVVLGFPANDFGEQEPGSNKEIASFCQLNYGVTFPVFGKSNVVGRQANPLFAELAAKTGEQPKWNFHKYLIDRSGRPVASFPSAVEPTSPKLVSNIERLLSAR